MPENADVVNTDTAWPTADAAKQVGLLPATFRARARRLGLTGTLVRRNHCGGWSHEVYLWPASGIECVRADLEARPGRILSPEARAARARAKANERAAAAALAEAEWRRRAEARALRLAEIRARYSGWQEAIPDAAAAMLVLNRWAYDHRREPLAQAIYALKNSFVEILFAAGHCEHVEVHTQQFEGRVCWSCGDDYDVCDRCGGTGWYRAPRVDELYCFYFRIDGRSYSWHQPAKLVNWPITLAGAPRQIDPMPPHREHGFTSVDEVEDSLEIVKVVVEGARFAHSAA